MAHTCAIRFHSTYQPYGINLNRVRTNMPVSYDSEAKDLAPLKGQGWYISRMKAAGYAVKEDKGYCFGMSYMALQAFLADDMKTFNDRLYVIASIPVEDFKHDFANLREKQQLLLQNGQQDEAKKIAETIVDILALFDGIALYHSTSDYKHLFEEPNKVLSQDAAKTMQITLPVSLDSKDNKPALISCHSGAYNQEDLKEYLAVMEKNLGSNSFALKLSCADHAINLNYDAKIKQWLLIDPNTLPGVEYSDAGLLAKAMLVAFGQSTGLVMETSLYTTHKHANNIQDDFLSMIQTPEWLELHSSSKLNTVFEDGWSQLSYAVRRNDIDWIQQRIADVNVKERTDQTAFGLAFLYEHWDIVKLLVEKGADVNAKSKGGSTALGSASSAGQSDIVKLLVEKGADVNAKGSIGSTALGLASLARHWDIVKLLVEKGADVNAKSNGGSTALESASWAGQSDIVKLLVEKGADVNAIGSIGYTALGLASSAGHWDIVKLLVEKGADVNAKSNDGSTALELASSAGHWDIVKLLIEKYADVKATDSHGSTAIQTAATLPLVSFVSALFNPISKKRSGHSKGFSIYARDG